MPAVVVRDSSPESPAVAAALAEIETHLASLRACLCWLIEQHFTVIDVELRRGRAKPQINVAPSPRLHIAFRDDCANVGRRQEGALTFHSWAARRFGCDIRWEEVTPCA